MKEKQQLAERYESKIYHPLWFQVNNAKFLKPRKHHRTDKFAGYPAYVGERRKHVIIFSRKCLVLDTPRAYHRAFLYMTYIYICYMLTK